MISDGKIERAINFIIFLVFIGGIVAGFSLALILVAINVI